MPRSLLWPDPRVKPPFGAAEIDWGHPLARGLRSYWTFVEGAGAVSDLVGQNLAVLVGNPSWTATAMRLAVTLDGSTQYLQCATSGLLLNGGGAVTCSVAASIITTDAGRSGGRAIYSERGTSGNDIFKFDSLDIGLGGGNNIATTIRNDGGTLLQAHGAITVNDGTPHLVILTKNGSAITLVVDGVVDTSPTWSGTDTFTDAVETRIGGDAADSGAKWKGSIGLLSTWTRMLSRAEAKWFAAEPYAMLRPIVRRRYFVPAGAVALSLADTAALGLQEAAGVTAGFRLSDATAVGLSEADALLAALTLAETLPLPLTDTLDLRAAFQLAETLGIGLTDSATLLTTLTV